MIMASAKQFFVICGVLLVDNGMAMSRADIVPGPAKANQPPVVEKFMNDDIKNHVKFFNSSSNDNNAALSFELSCRGSGAPHPSYHWFHDNKPIKHIENVAELSYDNSRLKLVNLTTTQAGYYHCEADNVAGKSKSEVIHITDDEQQLHYDDGKNMPITLEHAPKTANIELYGTDVSFLCSATRHWTEHSGPPTITWTKNGQAVLGQVQINDDANQLTIRHLNESHVGSYACNASNEHSYDNKNFYLAILSRAPSFVEEPMSVKNVPEKQTFVFHCEVNGYPKPDILWTFNGEFISSETQYLTITETENEKPGSWISDLKITDIKKGTNAGSYQCIASNSEGSVSGNGRTRGTALSCIHHKLN